MAVWTDLANVAYKYVMTSTFVNTLLENTRYLKEQIEASTTRGRITRSTTSTITTASSASLFPNQTGSFSIPAGSSRIVKCHLSGLLNVATASSTVAAVLQVDGTTVCEIQAASSIAGSAGRFRMGNSDDIVLAPGSHTFTVAVYKVAGGTTVDLVGSTVSFYDVGGA